MRNLGGLELTAAKHYIDPPMDSLILNEIIDLEECQCCLVGHCCSSFKLFLCHSFADEPAENIYKSSKPPSYEQENHINSSLLS